MKGGARRNKPDALRTLHNSRKRPRHRPGVPLDPVAALEAPPTLTAAERAYWAYYMPKLASVRVLTDVDRDALAGHCLALAQVAEIRTQQQAPTYRRLVAGRTNALDAQLRAWLQLARLSAAELGLSPVSRARVTPAGPTQERDALEDFIATPLRRVK